ncbi:golgin subfamily A member 1-like [Saccoglossus kowalevskii]|uniref:Golgin subfamily A member 1-like n=1 Tax=Saccoglossus kowalevskii TaxID=10224 RepID=A0ABM0MFW8_SACKO|nr:PREDICTED: golgin subfamily A member 1-like [Saccoglossus kowalevskii]
MFAKLKKKLVEEDGENPLNRSFSSPGPGQATRREPQSRNSAGRRESVESDNESRTSSPLASASKEELLLRISKKNERIKDLDSKVTEYGTMLKDAIKMKDKLEIALEKQQDAGLKRIQEMNEEYQVRRSKMSEDHALVLQNKEEEYQTQLQSILKEKSVLEDKVEKLEANFFKNREESDELQGFQTQEMAKIKHLFLNCQEELSKCNDELKLKTQQLEENIRLRESLETSLETNKKILEKVTKERDNLKQGRMDNADLIIKFEREKTNYTEKVAELNKEISEKCSSLHHLESKLNTLQDDYDSLKHSNDVFRQQMSSLVEEKESTITHLEKRIVILEQRLQDNDLNSDDQLKAAKTERDLLEERLEESRQHVNDVKTTWSSKITSLEQQISHLNSKMAEDNEELALTQQQTQTMKQNFEKQVEELKVSLKAAEDRALKNLELANEAESKFEVQKVQTEVELHRSRQQVLDAKQLTTEMRQHLHDKISALESQLIALETTKEFDKANYQQRIYQLENLQTEYLEKEIEHEKQIGTIEEDYQGLKERLRQKERECISVNRSLEEMTRKAELLAKQVDEETPMMQEQVNSLHEHLLKKEENLKEVIHEKEKIQKQNKDLLKEVRELLERCQIVQSEAHKLQTSKNDTLLMYQTTLNEKQEEVKQCHLRINELKERHKNIETLQRSTSIHDGDLDDSEINQLKKLVSELEDNLAEKNKTIKMQQQRLSDLKKTLQRELKIQSSGTDLDDINNRDREREMIPRSSTVPSGMNQTHISPLPPGHGATIEPLKAHEIRDTNFQYLRHVIFKYMCSSDPEAMQLIKAVAVLLQFSRQEERLVKETIEWKMSWFGSKPTPAKPLKMQYR